MPHPFAGAIVDIFSKAGVKAQVAHEHEKHQRRPGVTARRGIQRLARGAEGGRNALELSDEHQPRGDQGEGHRHAEEKQREYYTSPQVEIVKQIHKRLISDLQERPTIEDLSKEFLINTATLKSTFKGIYGQPIGTYMKEYRIRQAAALLRQTQATIAEIANKVGYENQSKFATAFRDVLNVAPAEYRKQNVSE